MTHSHSIKLKHQMFTLFDAYITTDFPHFGHKSVAVINKSILNVYHIKQQSPIYYQKWCEFIRPILFAIQFQKVVRHTLFVYFICFVALAHTNKHCMKWKQCLIIATSAKMHFQAMPNMEFRRVKIQIGHFLSDIF